jgi:hypothetical protein
LKGARFDDIASDGEKRLVNSLNDVGASEDEVIVAPLEGFPPEVLSCWVMQLDVGPHRAVIDEHAIGKGREI